MFLILQKKLAFILFIYFYIWDLSVISLFLGICLRTSSDSYIFRYMEQHYAEIKPVRFHTRIAQSGLIDTEDMYVMFFL